MPLIEVEICDIINYLCKNLDSMGGCPCFHLCDDDSDYCKAEVAMQKLCDELTRLRSIADKNRYENDWK